MSRYFPGWSEFIGREPVCTKGLFQVRVKVFNMFGLKLFGMYFNR